MRDTKQYKAICEQLDNIKSQEARTDFILYLIEDYLHIEDIINIKQGGDLVLELNKKAIQALKHQGRLELLDELKKGLTQTK